MARRRRARKSRVIYGHVNGITDIQDINRKIRGQIRRTRSVQRITELVSRSRYLVTLTYSPAWRKKFRGKIRRMRSVASREYETTARLANRRLIQLGRSPRYDVTYGGSRVVAT